MEELSTSTVDDSESDSQVDTPLLKITRAGNDDCVGKYVEAGTKDGCTKYQKEWTVPEQPDKKFCVEIFRQFSNENHKRYWWIMGRVFHAEKGHRLNTTLLYCVKSEGDVPPTSGWKVLKDGKKPTPKLKILKQAKESPKETKTEKKTPAV